MAINFANPTTARNYSTEFTQDIQNNIIGLAQWLDDMNTTITGTPPTYAKRFKRSTGQIQEYNGSTWADLVLGYVSTAASGGTSAGTITSTAADGFRVQNTLGTIKFYKDGTPTKAARLAFSTPDTNGLAIGMYDGTTWNNCLRILADGKVGINIAPVVAFHSLGEIRGQNNTALGVSLRAYGGTGVNGNLALQSNNGAGTNWWVTGGTSFHIGGNGSTEPSLGAISINTTGNVGVGTSPSAWGGTYKAIQVIGAAMWSSSDGLNTHFTNNVYYDGSLWRYRVAGAALGYTQNSGVHNWYTSPSGAADGDASPTLRMSLSNAGTLNVVGTVTAGAFSGALTGSLTGNVTGNVSGSSGSTTGNAAGSSTSCTGNSATATLATKASTLSQSGGSGTAMTFVWDGSTGGQPNWLWGSNDGITHKVFNPSVFNVASAGVAGSITHYHSRGDGAAYPVVWMPSADNQPAYSCTTVTVQSDIGRLAANSIYATGEVYAYSDRRVKTDIINIPNALSKVLKLNGVIYTRTDEQHLGKRQTGLIAQDVLAVLPEAVDENKDGMYALAYGNLVGLLVEAIKELHAEVAELKK